MCDQGLNDQPSLEVCVTGLVMKEREVLGAAAAGIGGRATTEERTAGLPLSAVR